MQTYVVPRPAVSMILRCRQRRATSAREFAQVIELIGRVKAAYNLPKNLKLGVDHQWQPDRSSAVQAGVSAMAELKAKSGSSWTASPGEDVSASITLG